MGYLGFKSVRQQKALENISTCSAEIAYGSENMVSILKEKGQKKEYCRHPYQKIAHDKHNIVRFGCSL